MIFYQRHRALCRIGGSLRRPGRCRPAVRASRPHPAGALRFGAAVRQNRPPMGCAGAFSGTTKGKRFIKYYILYKIKGGKSGARSLRPALFRCAEKVRRVGSPSGPAARSAAMCAGGHRPDGTPGAVPPLPRGLRRPPCERPPKDRPPSRCGGAFCSSMVGVWMLHHRFIPVIFPPIIVICSGKSKPRPGCIWAKREI